VPESPLKGMSIGVDPARDRARDIVVPDFRFIGMLTQRLGGQDRLIFLLLLGTAGRRSEVTGMNVGDLNMPGKRIEIRKPVVEVEGKLVTASTPKGGSYRGVINRRFALARPADPPCGAGRT
jgi:integrase